MAQPEPRQRYRPDRRPRRARVSERGKWTQVRKGIGACLFTLGIPLAIAGSIIVIVANTHKEKDEVPASFPVLGPVLLGFSVVFFAAGSIMTDMISIGPCVKCCLPDDPKSFCWKRCPLLFSILKPNEVLLLNRREAGLHALQTIPNKPVLKKITEVPNVPTMKRGVRFSDSDSQLVEPRASASSETSENGRTDGSPSSSLLSLRHCKIYPKETEKWVEMNASKCVEEEVNGDVFTLADSAVFSKDQNVFTGEHVTDMEHAHNSRAPEMIV